MTDAPVLVAPQSFRVCRCCRAVFSEPGSTPFCDVDCAATWASLYLTTPCKASELGLQWFVCYQPPDAPQSPGWRQREFDALMQEVR